MDIAVENDMVSDNISLLRQGWLPKKGDILTKIQGHSYEDVGKQRK